MKRSWIFALVAGNLVALVALAFVFPRPMISPGPLAVGHAAIADDCFACHAPFRGPAVDRCLTCHTLATIGIRTTKGMSLAHPPRAAFHQQLISRDCTACHKSHRGLAIGATNRHAFSHDLLAPEFRSQCQTCHVAPKTAVHQGLGLGCAQCHTTRGWRGAAFDHQRLFPLEGPHAAPCATCHTTSDYTKYTCFGCHAHQPDANRARHRRERLGDIENCAQCHRGGGRGEHESGGEGREGGERD